MIIVLAAYIGGISWLLLAGWAHQASKSPEQRHLDELIDCNDPYALVYARKMRGSLNLGAIASTGERFVLI